MADSAALTRMLIEAYDVPDRSGTPKATFEVMFNPTSYGYKHEVTYENAQGLGDASSPQNFENVQPQGRDLAHRHEPRGVPRDHGPAPG